MPLMKYLSLFFIFSLLLACNPNTGPGDTRQTPPADPLYQDVTATRLPAGVLNGLSMDARLADIDGDGDPDIVIAIEFRPNILLLNDGQGRFSDASDRLPRTEHDSEDVGIADFDGDGDLDIVTGNSNGPRYQEATPYRVYRNDGQDRFREATGEVLPAGTSGSGFDIEFVDVNDDGKKDLFLSSRGTGDLLLLQK